MRNSLLETLTTFAAGCGAGSVLSRVFGSAKKENELAKEIKELYQENEKYAQENKSLRRDNEDLSNELVKIHDKAKNLDSMSEDFEDRLDAACRELDLLRHENALLNDKLQEYKLTCESLSNQIHDIRNSNT